MFVDDRGGVLHLGDRVGHGLTVHALHPGPLCLEPVAVGEFLGYRDQSTGRSGDLGNGVVAGSGKQVDCPVQLTARPRSAFIEARSQVDAVGFRPWPECRHKIIGGAAHKAMDVVPDHHDNQQILEQAGKEQGHVGTMSAGNQSVARQDHERQQDQDQSVGNCINHGLSTL